MNPDHPAMPRVLIQTADFDLARVIAELRTGDGRTLKGRVDEPKGDPGNSLSRPEIEDKARRLAAYAGGASEAEMNAVIARIWALADWPQVGYLLP